MKEYAFDVNLAAVVRVKAENEDSAREAMQEVLDACSPSEFFLKGYNGVKDGVEVTEFTLCNEEGSHLEPALFEIDGVEYIEEQP